MFLGPVVNFKVHSHNMEQKARKQVFTLFLLIFQAHVKKQPGK